MTGTAWRVGDVVDDLYRVTAVHSHGGMGLVYRVRHLGWDVDLAVKSPRPALFRHPEGHDRFVAEAQTWISLGLHPHLCGCYYVRTIDSVPRIFAEYAEGGSVRDLIDGGLLREDAPDDVLALRLDLAIQTAWGLNHAHRRGVIHQDVKPANVLLGGDGTAKVTDFGLSRSRAILALPGQGDTSVAVTAGGFTPAYASPEQVAGEPLGRRTDVWSFAVTILETFSGGVTWAGGPDANVALARYQDAMPARLADLLARCLRHEQSARPGSMAEIADELRDIHEQEFGLYARTAPTEAAMRADELNNRALSLLDLGDGTEADDAFAEALVIDPNHLEATFNSGLLRWRRAKATDEAVMAAVAVARAGAPDRWEGAYLLGQLHLERGDLDAALPLLREAAGAAPDAPEVAATLRRAEAGELALPFEELPVPGGEGRMTAACVSADGRLVMTARVVREPVPRTVRTYLFGYDAPPDQQLVRICAVGTDRAHVLTGHDQMYALDLSADGRLAASGALDGTVHLWDVATGRRLHVLTGHPDMVEAVRFSPDGRVLATGGSADRTLLVDYGSRIRLWDVASGRCLAVLEGHTWVVRSVSFSADGSRLASVGDDRTLRLWDLRTGRCVHVLTHPDKLKVVGLSGDARVAVTGGDATRVWDLPTGECRLVLGGPVEDLSLRGGLVLTGNRDGEIRLWDLADGRCLRTFGGHRDEAARHLFTNEGLSMPVRIGADGRRAHSTSNRNVVRSWGLPTGYTAPLRLCRPRPPTRVQELDTRVRALLGDSEAAVAEGRLAHALASLSEARAVPGHERDSSVVAAWQRLSLATERVGLRSAWLARAVKVSGEPWVAISGDGRHALTTSLDRDKAMILWDLDTGRAERTYTQPVRPVYLSVLDMTVDAAYAVVGDDYQNVQLWDLRAGTCVRALGKPHSSRISVAIDRTGRTALVEQGDGVLRLWDLVAGRQLRTFRGPTLIAHLICAEPRRRQRVQEQVNGISLSADGRVVMAALQYSGVVYWHANRRRWSVLSGHTGRVDTVRVSADGRFAVTGGWDASVRYWDLADGACVRVLEGHTHPVLTVDISADGRFALSGGMDNTVRIWDIAAGRCVQVLDVGVASVRMSEDGTRAVSIGRGTLRVWELDWELTVREPADWDERAQPYLEQHDPDDGPDELLLRLRRAGLGWLRPEGVQRELHRSRARRRRGRR